MIRNATPKDASRLAEILIFTKRCTYRPIFQNDEVSFNEMPVLDLALHYRDDPGALEGIYVYDDGIIRGMMHIEEHTLNNNCAAFELEELYVDFFFQKQGIGRLLMEDFLKKATHKNADTAFLWVLEKNTAARRFYESFGFRVSHERRLQPETPEYLLKYQLIL